MSNFRTIGLISVVDLDGEEDGMAAFPNIRPRPGHELLTAVDGVLEQLTEPNSGSRLADDLRTALARTAATGDSCRVRQQADGARVAADLLLAGSHDEARPVLLQVRAELVNL